MSELDRAFKAAKSARKAKASKPKARKPKAKRGKARKAKARKRSGIIGLTGAERNALRRPASAAAIAKAVVRELRLLERATFGGTRKPAKRRKSKATKPKASKPVKRRKSKASKPKAGKTSRSRRPGESFKNHMARLRKLDGR